MLLDFHCQVGKAVVDHTGVHENLVHASIRFGCRCAGCNDALRAGNGCGHIGRLGEHGGEESVADE